MNMGKFELKLYPHKDGMNWMHLHKGLVGTSFYLTKDEILELREIMNSSLWDFYKTLLAQREPVVDVEVQEEVQEQPKYYSIGQRFVPGLFGSWDTSDYMLAQVGSKLVSLVSLTCGNRWNDGVPVGDPQRITEAEFETIRDKAYFKMKEND